VGNFDEHLWGLSVSGITDDRVKVSTHLAECEAAAD